MRYLKDRGRILRFVVQLEALIEQVWTPIVRYAKVLAVEDRMNSQAVADKIIDLSEQFNRYVFEHPEILDEIPDRAVLVLLDADDPEFNRANLALAEATPLPSAGQRVYIELQKRVRTVQQVHWHAAIRQTPQLA